MNTNEVYAQVRQNIHYTTEISQIVTCLSLLREPSQDSVECRDHVRCRTVGLPGLGRKSSAYSGNRTAQSRSIASSRREGRNVSKTFHRTLHMSCGVANTK